MTSHQEIMKTSSIFFIYGQQEAIWKSDFGFMVYVSKIFINKKFLSNEN